MSKATPQKPPISERNSVLWVDSDLRFMRENSRECPAPPYSVTHPKTVIVTLVIHFGVTIFAAFFGNTDVTILSICVSAILCTLFVVDFLMAQMRQNNFYRYLLDRGGEIAEPWNMAIIKRNKVVIPLTAALLLLILYSCAGFFLFMYCSGRPGLDSSSILTMMNYTNCVYVLCAIWHRQGSEPFIFMDIDEGMLFGGALFTYETLVDIRPTERRNGFELYHRGKKAALGRMLPNDMKHLQDMIELIGRYR